MSAPDGGAAPATPPPTSAPDASAPDAGAADAGAPLLVLGAGPAGLAAAYTAATSGRPVTVLERAGRVGGASASFEVDGVRVDLGSHRLHPSVDADWLEVFRSLLGDDLQTRPRNGRIRLADRWLAFPLRPLDAARRLPPSLALRFARDAALAPLRPAREDDFGAWTASRLGPTLLDAFYAPYARKLWGRPPDELAAEQARVRISAGSSAGMVRRLLRPPGDGTFLSPRRGYGQLWERLGEAAQRSGATIHLDTAVTRLEPSRRGVTVHTEDGAVHRARTVLSTLPLPLLPRLVRGAPPDVVAAASRLRSRAMTLVYLTLPTPRVTRFDAHYLPEVWTPITRISEPKNYRDSDEDPPDRTVLCAEIPCDVGDRWWRASDTDLRDLVLGTLSRLDVSTPTPTGGRVVRLPAAYPVYHLGFEADRDVVDGWARALPGLLTLGRQGLYVHDNAHHALRMGAAAVAAIDGAGRIDHTAWERARTAFAAHVVED